MLSLALVAVCAGEALAADGRPAHVLTDGPAGAPAALLRRWAPDEAGVRVASGVVARSLETVRRSARFEAASAAAAEAAVLGVDVGAIAASVRTGPPRRPFRALDGEHPAPVRGRPVAGFGPRPRGPDGTIERHTGSSWVCAPGEPVGAVAEGVVSAVRRLRGLGLVVVVDHGDQYQTVYARLGSATVAEGARVYAGDALGTCPEAGQASGRSRELYFEVRDQGVPVDPAIWLR